jgi:hypothetical protein
VNERLREVLLRQPLDVPEIGFDSPETWEKIPDVGKFFPRWVPVLLLEE